MSGNVSTAELIARFTHRGRHPSRVEMMTEQRSLGERVADAAARSVGSWKFIIIQTLLVAAWVILNVVGLTEHWDPYPFILLNLLFSVQAAYTGPILLLASNRQAAKDRAVAQRDDEEVGVIFKLQHEQMQILSLLRDAQDKHNLILETLAAPSTRAPANPTPNDSGARPSEA